MLKVLIFGGGSLLGQSLKKRQNKNLKFVLVNTKTKKNNCDFYLKSIQNKAEINKIFLKVKPQIVVFLSTTYQKKFSIEDRLIIKKVNLDFGKIIYGLSKKHNVLNFFYTSTISELERKINKKNYYVIFKKKLSNVLLNDESSKIINYIIYIPDTYSDNDHRDRLIPNLLKSLKKRQIINLFDDQRGILLISIENLSKEICKLFLKNKKINKTNRILILPKKTTNIKKIIEIVIKTTKRKDIFTNEIKSRIFFNFSKIKILSVKDNFEKWFKKKLENEVSNHK